MPTTFPIDLALKYLQNKCMCLPPFFTSLVIKKKFKEVNGRFKTRDVYDTSMLQYMEK
jgi:hypothetical protein